MDKLIQEDPSRRPPDMFSVCGALERAERWLEVRAHAPRPQPLTAEQETPVSRAADPCLFLAPPALDACDAQAALDHVCVVRRAFIPRFAAAAVGLAAAVFCLFAPVLAHEPRAALRDQPIGLVEDLESPPTSTHAEMATAQSGCHIADDTAHSC